MKGSYSSQTLNDKSAGSKSLKYSIIKFKETGHWEELLADRSITLTRTTNYASKYHPQNAKIEFTLVTIPSILQQR